MEKVSQTDYNNRKRVRASWRDKKIFLKIRIDKPPRKCMVEDIIF